MNKLYFLALAIMISNQVFGTTLLPHTPVYTAEIVHMKIDQNSYLANYKIQGGAVILAENQITLNLLERKSCPSGQMCTAVMPQLFKYTAQIIQKAQSCGSVYYRAISDKTPVDGSRVEIIVIDHSRRVCRDVVPFITEIKLEESALSRTTGSLIKYNHYFGAKKLQPWMF